MMFSRRIRRAALAVALALAASGANAHCLVGGRMFPSTLAIDDPCVNDELALPAVAAFGTGDQPANRQFELSGHYAKRVLDNVALMVGRGWTRVSTPGGARSGFVTERRMNDIVPYLPKGSPLVVIPDSDHHIMADQPLALVAAIRTQLANWGT